MRDFSVSISANVPLCANSIAFVPPTRKDEKDWARVYHTKTQCIGQMSRKGSECQPWVNQKNLAYDPLPTWVLRDCIPMSLSCSGTYRLLYCWCRHLLYYFLWGSCLFVFVTSLSRFGHHFFSIMWSCDLEFYTFITAFCIKQL